MTETFSEWVSVGDAAKIVGVSPTTIRRYEQDGLLSSFRTPTNVRRYRRVDVEALLTQPTAPTEATAS